MRTDVETIEAFAKNQGVEIVHWGVDEDDQAYAVVGGLWEIQGRDNEDDPLRTGQTGTIHMYAVDDEQHSTRSVFCAFTPEGSAQAHGHAVPHLDAKRVYDS